MTSGPRNRNVTPPERDSVRQREAFGAHGTDSDVLPLNDLWPLVEKRMGVCPAFFKLARDEPPLAWGLFRLAEFAYLDSPIPSLFKEALFVYLSRFCEVRYCVARHCAFLLGRGFVAGDRDCPPWSPEETLALLQEPLPREDEWPAHLRALEETPAPLDDWPDFVSELGHHFRIACAMIFIGAVGSQPWLRALRRLLGSRRHEQLMLFLAFIRMAHFWTHAHPELALEPDVDELLREHEELARLLLHETSSGRWSLTAALRESEAQLADLAGMRRLYDLHAKLAHETDLKTALGEIIAAACEFTGTDRGCVQLVSDDGERLEMFAHRGYDPDARFIKHFLRDGSKPACAAARRDQRRLIIGDTEHCPGLPDEDLEVARADGIRATQSTPMIGRNGETIGMLSTQFPQPHRASDHELRLLDMLAWTAANFVERQRAEAALRASEAQRGFLLKLSDALRPLAYPIEVQETAMRLLGSHLGVTRALYYMIDDEGGAIATSGFNVDPVPLPKRLRIADFGANLLATFQAGEDVIWSDTATDPGISEADRSAFAAIGVRANISVPLIKGGCFVAALAVHSPVPREWTAGELHLVKEVAERTWAAVERANAEAAKHESEQQYRLLFDSIDEGFCIIEVLFDANETPVDYRFLQMNPAFERQTGLVNAAGRTVLEMVPEHEKHWFEIYGRIALTGESARFENKAEALGRWYDVYAFRVDEPNERRVAILFRDIIEKKRAEQALRTNEERQSFLLKLSDALRPLADSDVPETACRLLAEKLGASRAQYCAVEGEPGVEIGQVLGEHVRAGRPLARRYPLAPFGESFVAALRDGQTLVLTDTQHDPAITEIQRQTFEAADSPASITVPLVKQGRFVANLTVHDLKPRHWADAEITLVEDVAERTWAAVERVRAEAALRANEERQAFLLNVSDALKPLADPIEIMAIVSEKAGRHFQVGRCGYAEVPPPHDHLVVARDWTNGVMDSLQGAWPLESFGEDFISQYRTGQTVVVHDAFEDTRAYGHEAGLEAAGNVRSSVSVQLVKEGQWVACFYVQDTLPRQWTHKDVELMKELAERTWAAVERARAEEAVRESEERLSLALDASEMGTSVWYPEEDRVESDRRTFALFGLPADSTLSLAKATSELTHPDDRAAYAEAAAAACDPAGDGNLKMDIRVVHPDGSLHWLSITAQVYFGGEPRRATRMAGVAIDITERKQAEAALRESAEFNRAVLESSPDCVKVLDSDSRLLTINSAGLQLLEIDDYTMYQGKKWDALWPKEHRRPVVEALATANAGETARFQAFAPTAKGTPKWWDVIVAPILDEQGRTVRLISVSRDITALKQAEDVLKEAGRRKDEFLATLAHELRNPLAPVRNALQILRLTSGQGEAASAAIETMEDQIHHMVRLVDDLLDVSRVSRGKIELRRGRIELSTVVSQAAEAARSLDAERGRGCELTVTLPAQPIYLHADPARLTQIIGNLLDNADKFTGEGGHVWLTAERDSDEAVIRVRDDGIGIAAEECAKIFEIFAQVDTSLERPQSGLGLGLTLVKNLVELHGGTVEASSGGLGEGSEFVVHLPVLTETPKPARTPETSGAGEEEIVTGRRILVVDDQRDSADLLATLLRFTRNEIRTAYDGLEGVAAAESFRPEIVLLDIGMPKLNGYDACRRIREQSWGKHMLLIALTGWGQEEDKRRTAEAGFDAHIVKPVEPAALTKLLAALLHEQE